MEPLYKEKRPEKEEKLFTGEKATGCGHQCHVKGRKKEKGEKGEMTGAGTAKEGLSFHRPIAF